MPRGRPRKRPAVEIDISGEGEGIVADGQNAEDSDALDVVSSSHRGDVGSVRSNEDDNVEVEAVDSPEKVPNLSHVKSEPQPSDEEEFIEVELDVDESPSTSAATAKVTPIASAVTTRSTAGASSSVYRPSSTATPSKRGRRQAATSVPRLMAEPKEVLVMPRRTPRTRAAAMHQLMLDSMKREVADGDEPSSSSSSSNSCPICKMELHSHIELVEHRRAYHKDSVSKDELVSGSLLCAHPHCLASFPDVGHLIAHLVAFHNQQQYRMRKINFDHIDKFDTWQKDMERNSRSVFIATELPEGTSTDLYRVQMYCEFCDEWRHQAERGPAHPQQVPNKLVGCPAHFTATIDNKKDKASVVGCFAHLGHHKKPSWSAIPCDVIKQERASETSVKCPSCDMMFRTRTAASRHRRSVHPQPGDETDGRRTNGEPKLPSLECGDQECDVVCDSMATLVQHVADAHRREDLMVEEYKFGSMDDFEQWKTRMESDTCAHYTKVSGREMQHEVSKYFLCHLSGHTNRSRRKGSLEERQRNRPTKKMGRYCTAFMSLKHNKQDGSVSIRGCLGHFGHAFDVRRLPVPELIRKEIADLLSKGCSEDDVVQIIRSRCSENERGYWLQRYEVRNVSLKMQKEGTLIKAVFNHQEEDEGDWDNNVPLVMAGAAAYHHHQMAGANQGQHPSAIGQHGMGGHALHQHHQHDEYHPNQLYGVRQGDDVKPVPGRFKTMRSLAEIHGPRRRPHSHLMPEGAGRFTTAPAPVARSINKQNVNWPMRAQMDLVEYVDAGDYQGDGEIVEMREVDGMMEGGDYYEEEVFDGMEGARNSADNERLQQRRREADRSGEKVVTLPVRVQESSNHHGGAGGGVTEIMGMGAPPSLPLPSRNKRIPLLKEPGVTGNADFDDLMQRIKDRIDKISQQLKCTQDVQLAEEMLKEIKSLEGRLVVQGVGQTTVPVVDMQMGVNEEGWQTQGVEEEEEMEEEGHGYYDEYPAEHGVVSHEEEVEAVGGVVEEGYEGEEVEEYGEEEGVEGALEGEMHQGTMEVESEEIVA